MYNKMRKQKGIFLFILILPALVIYTGFWLLPVFSNIPISFTRWTGLTSVENAEFIGLSNYKELLRDAYFWKSLRNNLVFTAFTLIIGVPLSLGLAVLLEKYFSKIRAFLRLSLFLPSIMSWVVVGLLWTWMYNPSFGLINTVLRAMGLGNFIPGWLSDPDVAMYSVIITALWKHTGFYTVIFLSGLQTIPKDLTEAASIDGASPWQCFYSVILPLLRPFMIIVSLLIIIDGFRVFDVVYTMTGGGPGNYSTETLAVYLYRVAFYFYKSGYGATISLALFGIVALISYYYLKMTVKQGF